MNQEQQVLSLIHGKRDTKSYDSLTSRMVTLVRDRADGKEDSESCIRDQRANVEDMSQVTRR